MSSEPWYQDGLRFSCTRCGHCCTGEPGFVWVDDADLAALAEFRGETVEEIKALYTRWTDRGRTLREKLDGDCVFYDRNAGCTVYPVRPPQCRTWPFWESNVHSPETWQHACEICPGSGQGELIPAEEITRRLNVIRL
jgi:Fe-S-cluster containining protein